MAGAAGSYDGIELHLIGPLQTNKAREAVALFDVIETVDRDKLAVALRGRDGAGRASLPLLRAGQYRARAAKGRHCARTRRWRSSSAAVTSTGSRSGADVHSARGRAAGAVFCRSGVLGREAG